MQGYKLFFSIYVISAAIMYFLFSRSGGTSAFPGDIYRVRGTMKIYVPVGSAFFLALFIYIILMFLKKNMGIGN